MKAQIRPSRMIVHLSAYDDSYVPRRRDWTPVKRVLVAIGLIPAFVTFIFPSFKLGRTEFKAPPFAIPHELKSGEAFAFPVSDLVASIRAQGQPMARLDRDEPMVFGAIPLEAPERLSIDISYNPAAPKEGEKPRRRTFKEIFLTHPTVPYFKQVVHVTSAHDEHAPPVHLPARIVGNYENEEANHSTQPPEIFGAGSTPSSIANKIDLNSKPIKAACWQSPVPYSALLPFGVFKAKPGLPPSAFRGGLNATNSYRHLGVDLRTAGDQPVVAPGDGQVVAVTARSVTLAHGGGLYTRYLHMKEARVGKGDRIRAGQTIGTAGPMRKFEPPRLHWEIFFEKKPIDPQSFLALSAKICDKT
jgi:hypothetical protein